VELRPTTGDDLPAIHETFTAAVGSVFRPHAFEPPEPSAEVFALLQRHVAATGLSYVAEQDGSVVGFGSSWTRGDDWFLASLFVRPEAQGQGVGPALLDAVWGDARRRRTMTDAIQPVSNALYGRRGLIPVTPILTFTGIPRLEIAVEESDADIAAVDAAAYGFDRTVDHDLWSPHARRTTWPGAYSYAFPGGDVGPVAGLTPAAAAAALSGELGRADRPVRVRVPGSARPLVEVALRAGLRLGDVPGFLLVSDGVEPPTALAPSGYLLY
jgi:GNAT superfamily N-acetyltransferase